jgi:nucleotide-binding universal stress UspA family protein
MNPIIVAVDFSNTSIHAIDYAIPLANKMKSDIILAWVDKITTLESIYPDTSNESRNEAKKRLDELVEHYTLQLGKGQKIEYKLKKGKIYHELDNIAKQAGADLIITGAHGISGYEEFWIGSNAFKIVTYASCPVITVRHDFMIPKTLKRILVPIDGSAETMQKLPFVVCLSKLFKSEVHIVTTHNSHLKSIQRIAEKYAQTAISFLKTHGIAHVEDSITSNDLTKATIAYAEKVGADVIAVMTEQESPANILLGAQAQQLINQSPVPVLSIHVKEHFCL